MKINEKNCEYLIFLDELCFWVHEKQIETDSSMVFLAEFL